MTEEGFFLWAGGNQFRWGIDGIQDLNTLSGDKHASKLVRGMCQLQVLAITVDTHT